MKYFLTLFILLVLPFSFHFSAVTEYFRLGETIVSEFEAHEDCLKFRERVCDDERFIGLISFPDDLRQAFNAIEVAGSALTIKELYETALDMLIGKLQELNVSHLPLSKKIYEIFEGYVISRNTFLAPRKISNFIINSAAASESTSDFKCDSIPIMDVGDFHSFPLLMMDEADFKNDADSKSEPPTCIRRDSIESFGFDLNVDDFMMSQSQGERSSSGLRFQDPDSVLKRSFSVFGSPSPLVSDYNPWILASQELGSLAEGIFDLAENAENEKVAQGIRSTIPALDDIKNSFMESAGNGEAFSIQNLSSCLQGCFLKYIPSFDSQDARAVMSYLNEYIQKLHKIVEMRTELMDSVLCASNASKRARFSPGPAYPEVNENSFNYDYGDEEDEEDEDVGDENEVPVGDEAAAAEGENEANTAAQEDGEDDNLIDVASAELVSAPENMAIFDEPKTTLSNTIVSRNTDQLNSLRSLYYGLTDLEFAGMNEDALSNLQVIMDEAFIGVYNDFKRK